MKLFDLEAGLAGAPPIGQLWPEQGGIPPVETVCEYRLAEGAEWRRCVVVAHYFARVVAVDVYGGGPVLLPPIMFRPIKTPEQIAAEERQQAIDEMMDLAERYGTVKGIMSALYDAGYRKMEVEE